MLFIQSHGEMRQNPYFVPFVARKRRKEQTCIMLKIRVNYAIVYLTGDDEDRSNKRAPDSSKRGLCS